MSSRTMTGAARFEEVCISRRMETLSSGGLVSLLNARTSMLHAQALAEVQGRGRTVMQRPVGQELFRGTDTEKLSSHLRSTPRQSSHTMHAAPAGVAAVISNERCLSEGDRQRAAGRAD